MVSDVSLATVYTIAGIFTLVLLRPPLANRDNPGSTGVILVSIGIATWLFTSAVLTVSPSQTISSVVFSFRIAGALLTAIAFFLIFAAYADYLKPTRSVLVAVGILVTVDFLLTVTNPLHHLMYVPGNVLSGTNIPLAAGGPAFVAHLAISYLLIVTGVLIGIGEIVKARGIRRRQALTLVGTVIPPIALNFLYTVGLPISFDPTPLGFVLSIIIAGWALFSEGFLDIVPVGRHQTVENMEDPMAVLDDQGRIVDSNPAARQFVGVDGDWEGMKATEFFAPLPELLEQLRSDTVVDTEIRVSENGVQRYFDLNISPIPGPQGNNKGRLIVLRDISELKEREQELDLMRQVQSRVLRHNIRNDLQVVKMKAEIAAEDVTGETQQLIEDAIADANDLVAISNKARLIEKLVDEEQTPTSVNLTPMVEQLIETYRREFPDVEFQYDCPQECYVTAIPAVEFALENLIENAAEHNSADDSKVDVLVTEEAEATIVTILDNGSGIPDHELTVLEESKETPLQHGSGIGLWVVQWVLDRSSASIEYETGTEGTEITTRFPN